MAGHRRYRPPGRATRLSLELRAVLGYLQVSMHSSPKTDYISLLPGCLGLLTVVAFFCSRLLESTPWPIVIHSLQVGIT